MPKPIPIPIREKIFERMQKDHDPAEIAADLNVKLATVRKLIARFEERGAAGVAPSYQRRGNPRQDVHADLVAEACELRRAHATWGAGLIRVQLHERHPERELPSLRTIERQLAKAGLAPAPRGPRTGRSSRRATEPHETWQMDAAERLKLADGTEASWLRITDECSGAVLKTAVFPPRSLEYGTGGPDSAGLAGAICRARAAPADPRR